MWLRSRFRLLPVAGRALVLCGGEAYGAPFLVERLRSERQVVWLSLGSRVSREPVALGNLLAVAVNRSVGGKLLDHALPYRVHLRTLERHGADLKRLTMVVSHAQAAPGFAGELAAACTGDFGVWLLCDDGDDDLPEVDGVRIGSEQLRLEEREALDIAPRGISRARVLRLLDETGGAYLEFLRRVQALAELPEPIVPGPDSAPPVGAVTRAGPTGNDLDGLVRLGRLLEALEVAAESEPERVEDLLAEAGPEYQQQGLLERLHGLLESLPDGLASRERTLEWRLTAAYQCGRVEEILPRVRAYLQVHEAPDLRARYAALVPYEHGLAEARRAARARETALTLWQYGRMHPDAHEGIELLTRSIASAELAGDALACCRAAGTLASRHNHLGDFGAARSWASWGLQIFDERGLKDGVRRLRLQAELAFCRTMLGETPGLREWLRQQLRDVDESLPDIAGNLRELLSDQERLEGEREVAAELARINWEAASRHRKGLRAVQYVRSLLELGRLGEARAVARSAVALSAGVAKVQDARARLALGMVQAYEEPESAVVTLSGLLSDEHLAFELRATAALHLLLANDGTEQKLPLDLRERLSTLGETALRLLSGNPEVFHPVWSAVGGSGAARLELRALGRREARLEGRELRLTKRQWEILVLLAFHPEGVGYQELHDLLVGDSGRLGQAALRSHVTFLRERIPITSSPYRIELPYTLDAVQVMELLAAGRPAAALALYSGPLLPGSTLPGVRELGRQVEESLRQAILAERDPELLFAGTALWSDDLELCEAGVQSLHPRDPRVPILRARIESLRADYGL